MGQDGRVEIAIGLLAIVAAVLGGAWVADRVGLPSPLVLIAIGIIGSYLPFVPEVKLTPELVLLGILPPLLYAAAIRTSLVDFRNNKGVILSLSVGLVLFTALGVALFLRWTLGIPFGVAFAVGAVVAPPDAVAATAIGRQIGLPRRLVTILEGESLVNDATALVALRTALAAAGLSGAAAADVTAGSIALDFARASLGGIAIGLAVAARTTNFFAAGVLLYAFFSGVAYAAFSAIVLVAIGRGAAATKYALLSSFGNIPVIYMTSFNSWTHDRYGTAGMLWLEAVAGIGCVALGLAAVARLRGRR